MLPGYENTLTGKSAVQTNEEVRTAGLRPAAALFTADIPVGELRRISSCILVRSVGASPRKMIALLWQ